MANFATPGVFFETTSHPQPITGVSPSTVAMLGPTKRGSKTPTLITSHAEFLRIYGEPVPGSHLGVAVKGFFNNGGQRCIIGSVAFVGLRWRQVKLAAYLGSRNPARRSGLSAMEEQDEVALIAIPDERQIPGLTDALIDHCEKLKNRFAVTVLPFGQADAPGLPPVRDTRYCAAYGPWIRSQYEASGPPQDYPPIGQVLGIYARTDIQRGVHKAPANEVVQDALGLEVELTPPQQAELQGRRVNEIRKFPGRGIRVWGARTMSSDPDWRYVNVCRFGLFLERSIQKGLQWAVFEPNAEPLWARMRGAVELFLFEQWRAGALVGSKPDQAYFVRIGRDTMTAAHLAAGRLIMQVGVAPVKPAEFVILRIGWPGMVAA